MSSTQQLTDMQLTAYVDCLSHLINLARTRHQQNQKAVAQGEVEGPQIYALATTTTPLTEVAEVSASSSAA